MPDQAQLCQHYRQFRDTFRAQADAMEKIADDLVKELDDTLVGKYRDDFLDDMKKAKDVADRIAAAKKAAARLAKDANKLFKKVKDATGGGAPVDPWPPKAQRMLQNLDGTLNALKALRDLQKQMETLVKAFCG
jgi:ribosomal protein S17E